ncbi:MAG: hypothetical protein QXV93_02885 [Zestosphaera sp.]
MPFVDPEKWRARKEKLRKRLIEDLEIGYLDEDILDILRKLFEFEDIYTISSCSGRITFIDGNLPWERKDSSIVFKKHQPIKLEELLEVLNTPTLRRLWLVVTGPIIHASALNMRSARKLLTIARESGMKHSGILSINKEKGIIVELKTGIRLTHLLKISQHTLLKESEAEEIVRVANESLIEGKKRLNKLRELLGIQKLV